jgi:hypothetical protein
MFWREHGYFPIYFEFLAAWLLGLQAKFPKVKPHELDLSLLYPILQLLGQQRLNWKIHGKYSKSQRKP